MVNTLSIASLLVWTGVLIRVIGIQWQYIANDV